MKTKTKLPTQCTGELSSYVLVIHKFQCCMCHEYSFTEPLRPHKVGGTMTSLCRLFFPYTQRSEMPDENYG